MGKLVITWWHNENICGVNHVTSGYHNIMWAQYAIDLPGSLHTNKIHVILGRYPLLGFFCRLNIVPLDRDNGTFNSE